MSDITLRDYTALYKIKQYMANTIAPKYFSFANMDDSNIGLFGYVTEILANNVEDSFFATSMLFKEIFPVTAEDPESIYLMAALFQLDSHFATPAMLGFNLLIDEEEIISHATFKGGATNVGDSSVGSGYWEIEIDKDTIFNIENVEFRLDYDIILRSKRVGTDQYGKGIYTHSAVYDFNFNNSISNITSIYIPTRTHTNPDTGRRYVLMSVNLHQVTKSVQLDTILTNDVIKVINKEYVFNPPLANFEIYYRESDSEPWVQMKKFLAHSTSVDKDPSFYYKFTDENKLLISFNIDERYFIPKYGSNLKIEFYESLGADGNFSQYAGSEIAITSVSERYPSNKGLIFIGTTRGASMGGYNAKSLEELRVDVIKAFSTVKSFTTANDLTLYFNTLRLNENNELLIIKQRDDALKRLFSTFVLFKDSSKNIIPTNTVDLYLTKDDLEIEYGQSSRYPIPAGKLYTFMDGSTNLVKPVNNLSIKDDLDGYEGGNTYLYVNPFLTILGVNPTSCGYYINSINEEAVVDYNAVNQNSFNQFIVNSIKVERNAVFGEMKYKLTAKLYPSTDTPEDCFTEVKEDTDTEGKVVFHSEIHNADYIDNGILNTIVIFNDNPDVYLEFKLTDWDEDAYYMTAEIETDDYVSLDNKFKVIDGFRDIRTGEVHDQPVMVKSSKCGAILHTFLTYADSTTSGIHDYTTIPKLANATLTNTYSANKDLNFIIPIPEIISTMNYIDDGMVGDVQRYHMNVLSMPVIKANTIHSIEDFDAFLSTFNSMYLYIKAAMDNLVNNFSIDLKFFNTYGPSRHFYCYNNNDESDLMDRINISLKFGIKFNIITGLENAISNIKDYIKAYVENDNISLISSPSLYISNLIQDLKNNFSNISYITFKGVNDYDENFQKFESEVNDINVLEGSFATNDVVPEYLNINYIYKKGIKTADIKIDVL